MLLYVTIRPLAENDSMAELTALIRSAYKSLADMGFRYWGTWQSEEDTRLRCSEGHCLVVEDEGRLVGTLTVKLAHNDGDPDWYKREGVWVVTQFAVQPEQQGSGLGSELLKHAEELVMSLGGTEASIDTAEGAKHLIRFYSKRGYRHVGHVDWSGTNYVSVLMSKCLQVTLKTERLVLRPVCMDDLSAALSPEFARAYPPGRMTAEFCEEVLCGAKEENDRGDGWNWSILLDGEVIGRVRLSKRPSSTGELGYEIAPKHWTNGFATEAVRAALEFGFGVQRLHRVQAYVFANNDPSQRLLRKVGFAEEGCLREKVQWGEARMDDLIFGLLASEWEQAGYKRKGSRELRSQSCKSD